MTLEETRNQISEIIKEEMKDDPLVMFSFDSFAAHGLDVRQVGRIFKRFKNSLRLCLPEYKLEFKPDWDYCLEVYKR